MFTSMNPISFTFVLLACSANVTLEACFEAANRHGRLTMVEAGFAFPGTEHTKPKYEVRASLMDCLNFAHYLGKCGVMIVVSETKDGQCHTVAGNLPTSAKQIVKPSKHKA